MTRRSLARMPNQQEQIAERNFQPALDILLNGVAYLCKGDFKLPVSLEAYRFSRAPV
jgi:hypothetical protein